MFNIPTLDASATDTHTASDADATKTISRAPESAVAKTAVTVADFATTSAGASAIAIIVNVQSLPQLPRQLLP